MVFIPLPPSQPFPDFPLTEELRVNRLNTSAFIAADPILLILKTRVTSRTPSGGSSSPVSPDRPQQRFKLIQQSPAGGSIEQRTFDGTERQVDFVLLGEWNAAVAIGDFWNDVDGTRFELASINPYNGYEVRANIEAHGKIMAGG